jgi:hypothetical protein
VLISGRNYSLYRRYGNLAGIPAVKAAGSLTTVLSSGLVAVIASRKAVRA